MAELEIVVRARDQLTATLRAMGTAVDRLAQQVRTEFDQAGGAVDQVALGLTGAGQAAAGFGGAAQGATQGVRQLAATNVEPLRASLAAARVELNELERQRRDSSGKFIAGGLIPHEDIARAKELRTEIGRLEVELDAARAAASGFSTGARASVGDLRASITATRIEIDRIRASGLVSPESIQRVAELDEEVRRAERSLEDLGGVEIDISGKVSQAEQAFRRLGSEASLVPLQVEINRARAEVERLESGAREAGVELSQLDRVRIDQLTRDIKEGEAAILGLKRGADAVPPAARGIGTAFTTAGAAIKSALLPLLPIFGVVGSAFFAKKAAEDSLAFTAALGQIRTEGGLTEAELTSLGDSARATARALGLSDADAAPALLAAVTDGAANAADGLDRYNAAVRLASVTGSEVKRVTDVLTSTLNAYSRQGLGAARASDVLFEVARSGKVEIDELAGGLEGILPLASQLGISFEELGAVLVTATRQGGGFEQGVQAIRATLGALTNISDEGAEALRGIDYSAAAIRARGLVPVLADISERLRGNSDAIRAVFPDGRSFGALLAVLANGGRDLSDSLFELQGASGAVEDAIGRKLQSPMVQLGIIVNRLRSELGDRLGAAFTDAVSRAVATLGGLESAAKKIGDIGQIIGAGIGSGLGVLGEVISDQVERLSLFVDSIGGAEAIVKLLEQSARTAASAVGAVLVVSREFFEISLAGLENVRAGWVALLATLRAIPGVDLAIAGLDALIASPEEARERVAGLNRELTFLEDKLAKANAQKLDIAPDDTAGLVLIESRIKDFEARISSVKGKIQDVGAVLSVAGRADALFGTDKFGKLEQDLAGLAQILDGSISKPRSVEIELDVKGDIETQLRAAEERVVLFERGLSSLRRQAEQALDGRFSGETLNQFLTLLAGQALQGRDGLNEAAEAAAGLRRELAQALRGDLSDKRAELDRLKEGFADARSAAELLGEAGKALDSSFQVDAIAAVESEIAGLQKRIDQLLARDIKIKPSFEIPETIVTAGRIGKFVLPVQVVAGAGALDILKRQIESAIKLPKVFADLEAQFRGGVEPSLERQANAIDRQVAKQRAQIGLWRTLGLLDVGRLATLEQATAELDKQADALRDQADEIRRSQRLEAISLGIDIVPFAKDEDGLRREIERVRARLALESEAISLGVEFDVSTTPEKLTADIRDALQRAEREGLEGQAIQLGIGFKGVDSAQLREDIEAAQREADAFAKSIADRNVELEAIRLGIKLDEKSIPGLEREIDRVRLAAQEFATLNPIKSEALTAGIRGFGTAIGQIASGAQTAKEALRSFFQSFVQQVAGAIAQALLLRAIIGSLGAGSKVGSFLAATFGVPPAAAKGAVFPAARGMAVPGLTAAALAMAPVVAFAQGGAPDFQTRLAPIAFSQGETPVRALALGGAPATPHLDRIVSAPTYAPLSSLAGAAVVPLKGGGVETTSGERLPVTKRGGELVVAAASGIEVGLGRAGQAGAVPFAAGGAPVALYGEAGHEAIMRTYEAPGGGPGLRMASGGVAPLTRVAGGRLGLALADGAALSGALPDAARTAWTHVAPFAAGTVQDIRRGVWTEAVPFALGAAPGLERTVKTSVIPFALGGIQDIERAAFTSAVPFRMAPAKDATRAIRSEPIPFALGGAPDLARSIRTHVEPFALGGIPDAIRHVRNLANPPTSTVLPMAGGAAVWAGQRGPIVPLATGGLPAAAAQVIQARPVAPVNIAVPVTVNVAGGASAPAAQEDPRQVEARLQAAISTSSKVREAIAAVVSREMEARPSFRANVRGDRA